MVQEVIDLNLKLFQVIYCEILAAGLPQNEASEANFSTLTFNFKYFKSIENYQIWYSGTRGPHLRPQIISKYLTEKSRCSVESK